MTDRERRLHRALVRYADAFELLESAAIDLGECCPERAAAAERLAGRARWLVGVTLREFQREVGRGPGRRTKP